MRKSALKDEGRPVRPDSPLMDHTVMVWDIVVRAFHWALVGGITYQFLAESGTKTHRYVGYTLIALIAVRIIWGFIGTKHARFGDFVKRPQTVLSYVRQIIFGHPKRFLGHNPAGGAMVIALMVAILSTAFTGWLTTTDLFWGVGWVEDLHSFLSNGILTLVCLHVLGILLASFQHRENLIRAMLTGRKKRK